MGPHSNGATQQWGQQQWGHSNGATQQWGQVYFLDITGFGVRYTLNLLLEQNSNGARPTFLTSPASACAIRSIYYWSKTC